MSESHYVEVPDSAASLQSDEEVWNCRDVMCFIVISFLIFFFIVVPLGVFSIGVFFFLSTIFGLATSLLLFISLLVTRTLQLIKSGDEYEALSFYYHLIRTWLCIIPSISLVGLAIFFLISRHVPSLKQVTLLEVPLTEWIELIIIICVLCAISSALYLCVMQVFSLYVLNGRKGNTGQAVTEIIDCLIFWGATKMLMKYVPYIKHHEILGLPTRNWIWVLVIILISYNLLVLITRIIVWFLRLAICQLHPQVTSEERFDGSNWKSGLKKHFHGKYVVYYANGMIVSSCFVMSSLVLLLTWVLYFGSHLDLKLAHIRNIWEFGKWTFISLLICSFLWLIKTFVLLVWEAHTVYTRLRSQIISASEQLYFLGILGSLDHNFLKLQHNDLGDFENVVDMDFEKLGCFSLSRPVAWFVKKINMLMTILNLPPVRKSVQNGLLIQNPTESTLDDIQQATQYFFVAKQCLAKETYICDILKNFHPTRVKWKKLLLGEKVDHDTNESHEGSHAEDESEVRVAPNSNQNEVRNDTSEERSNIPEIEITESSTENPVQENEELQNNYTEWSKDLEDFLHKLEVIKNETCSVGNRRQENLNPETPFSFSDIQTWVERAHNQCVSLVNTISSAKEVADCLNKIISWLMIGAIFIMWLLLTGLATTEVFVLIASPLLAASFIFGDTCKTLFQGIIYVFVVHPFDVGDLCFIEEKMMEVRSIGIWTTTFKKVDKYGSTQELVIHSNSQLKNKTITNYKTKFDWSDRVEFNLGPMNGEEKRTIIMNFFTDSLKLIEAGNHLTSNNNEEGFHLNHDDTRLRNVSIPVDNNEESCLKKKLMISSSPHLTISTMEDNIMLVIHLEYKAENTKEWTYSKRLRRKDELKGDFHLYMQNLVSEFKVQHGRKGSQSTIIENEPLQDVTT